MMGGDKCVYTWGIYYYNKGAPSVDTKFKNYNFTINSSILALESLMESHNILFSFK